MELISWFLIFVLLVAAAVIACLAIYRRKRRQQAQPKVESRAIEEVQPTVAGEPQNIVAAIAEPTATEGTQLTPVDKAQVVAAPEAQPTGMQEAESAAVAETKPAAGAESQSVAAEESRRAVTEETQPTVVGEGQPIAPEKTELTVVEETQHTAPEKTKPTVAEETQQQIAEGVPTKTKGERREPEKRGGRPRGRAQSSEERAKERAKEKSKQYGQKPEIVCWKKEREWIIGIEVPEDLLSNPGLEVLQNGRPLKQDGSREGYWLLNEAHGQVSIQIEDSILKEINITRDEVNYLLFKLSGPNWNRGRRVKSPSSGWYLVVVPESWERDDALSGPPPVTPEPVSLAGYRSHFFVIERSGKEKIAFRTPEGKPAVIEPKAPRFALVGDCLNDATEDKGPLFGERPPQIRALHDQGWKDVGTIVVGEEGSGRGRWRKQFKPVLGRAEQDLPSEVADRKGGWFFLRFYDTNDDLIESLDFRFISALREIRISQPPPLPSEVGHRPVYVEFLHEPGCAVQLADDLTNIQIKRQDDKTILAIPPDPTYDETRWVVGPEGGPQVEVNILVERLWWTVGEEEKEPAEWKDQPLTLTRNDFAATSKKALWLRLPRRRWVNKVLVGFEQEKARPYDVKIREREVCIPLREISYAQEVRHIGITPLHVWFSLEGTTYTASLCEVVVKARCGMCDFIGDSEEDMLHHVESRHLEDIFTQLTYKEMIDLIPSLPPAIYKCSYCNFYVKSDDLANPTSTIINHIEKNCKEVPRGMGPVRINFSVVSDVDEIRENVISDLQRIHKCTLCGFHLNEATRMDMLQHLTNNHRNEVYKLF